MIPSVRTSSGAHCDELLPIIRINPPPMLPSLCQPHWAKRGDDRSADRVATRFDYRRNGDFDHTS